MLDACELEETAAIDSAPVPCVSYQRGKQSSDFAGTADYGVGSSKAIKSFGCKFQSVVSLSGLIMGFLLTPASRYDNQPVVELLDSFAHHLKLLLGDGADNDAALQDSLHPSRCLHLLAPVRGNQLPKRAPGAQKPLNRFRLICETVNAQGPRAVALVQALCEKHLGTDDPHCRQGDGSEYRHDDQHLFGQTGPQVS